MLANSSRQHHTGPLVVAVQAARSPLLSELLRLAQAEAPRGLARLQPYSAVVRVLRDHKGFSFRELAVWLCENAGVCVDHNTLYRFYKTYVRAQWHSIDRSLVKTEKGT